MTNANEFAINLSRGNRTCAVLLAIGLSVTQSGGQTPKDETLHGEPALTTIHNVVDVVGLGDFKHRSGVSAIAAPSLGPTGDLVFDPSNVTFVTGQSRLRVPLQTIRAFSISHDNVALLSGIKGTVASFAPFGAGTAIGAVRVGSDTLSLVYVDDNNAVRGAVLLLPKDKGADVAVMLAKVGLVPEEYSQAGPVPMQAVGQHESKSELKSDVGLSRHRPSVEVALFTESVDGIPSAFPVGSYEELIAQLTNSGKFEHVWRQGDSRVDADALTLHVNLHAAKKGSARGRGLIPFTNATTLKTDVKLTDGTQKVVFNGEIDTAQRMRGESMLVTQSLAKKIKSELLKSPNLNVPSAKDDQHGTMASL